MINSVTTSSNANNIVASSLPASANTSTDFSSVWAEAQQAAVAATPSEVQQQTTVSITATQAADEQLRASINLWRSLMKSPSTSNDIPAKTSVDVLSVPEPTQAPASAAESASVSGTTNNFLMETILQDALAKVANANDVTPTEAQPSKETELNELTTNSSVTNEVNQSAMVVSESSVTELTQKSTIQPSISDLWRSTLSATQNSQATSVVSTEAPEVISAVAAASQSEAWEQTINDQITNSIQQSAQAQLERMLAFMNDPKTDNK